MKRLKEYFGKKRHEAVDPTPMALPVGFKHPEPIEVMIARLVRSARVNEDFQRAGIETFEEADDFNIPDDPVDPTTPYEETFDPLHIAARVQEEKAGVSEGITEERRSAARAIIDRFRRKPAAAAEPPAAALKAEPTANNGKPASA